MALETLLLLGMGYLLGERGIVKTVEDITSTVTSLAESLASGVKEAIAGSDTHKQASEEVEPEEQAPGSSEAPQASQADEASEATEGPAKPAESEDEVEQLFVRLITEAAAKGDAEEAERLIALLEKIKASR